MAELTIEQAYKKAQRVSFPPWEAFLRGFRMALDSYLTEPLPQSLYVTMVGIAVSRYEEMFIELPPIGSGHRNANRAYYENRIYKAAAMEKALDHFTRLLLTGLLYFIKSLPSLTTARQPFVLPASDLVKDRYSIFEKLKSHLTAAGTEALLKAPIPYGMLPDEERFRHSWIVAPTGTGKTNLLETLIYCDLERVAKNEASIFIMDSQNEMIPRLTGMKEFHEGPLKDKLIVLEPSSEFPLALNIFDNQLENIQGFSQDDRDNLYASSLEMADFVMSGLLGADLTSKQKGIFRYITQALQVIPNATIETFADLLRDDGYAKYAKYIQTLRPRVVDFFQTRFQSSTFKPTREEIYWRLDAIMSISTFADMFSHPKNKFNLFDELQSAKVICVNTKLGLLKKEGTEIFGRYFLAMLLQATERRMLIDKSNRLPTFCYIDECHDYIATEPKMAALLDKARKQKVGFTLAHQRLQNIKNADVLDAIANVWTKMAGRNQTDAPTLAKFFRVEPEVLSLTPTYSFAVNTGGATHIAACPPSPVPEFATATKEQLTAFRDKMRATYSAPPHTSPSPSPSPPLPEHDPPTIDGEVVDTDPIRDGDIRAKPTEPPSRRLPRPSKDDVDIKPSKDW